jgi:uncharacterized protein YigE (DUF2233 family)
VKRTQVLLFLVMSMSCLAQSRANWSAVRPGMDLQNGSFADHGESVGYVLFRVDPVKSRIRVIDTYHEIGKANSYAAFSIREVKAKTGASLVVNAGSTASFSIPAPVGLLQVNGRVVSPPNYTAKDAGVLCFAVGRISIVSLSKDQRLECSQAVQRGPVLLPQTPPSTTGSQRHNRTIAAVDSKGRLIILVTSEPATLAAVKNFLYDSGGDLKVVSALNMDADTDLPPIFSPGIMRLPPVLDSPRLRL